MANKQGDFWINKKGDEIHQDNVSAADKIKDELVEKLIADAVMVRDSLFDFKKLAFEEIESYYELLLQNYNIDGKKNSRKGNLTIENYSGTAKVTINIADRIAFDEKLTIAKTKIDEYLHEITKNASADIQTLITKAFEVDKKGDVNAKKILALKSYEITHPKWIEAMDIISEATEIVSSKSYIRFYARDDVNKEYKLIPLDIAGFDMRVAVVIGHSETSQGARNSSYGVSEFEFNRKLAHDIEHNFSEYNLIDEIVVVYRENGYAALPKEINELEPDLIVSLHCNAFDTEASGCEMLYYHKSEKSKEISRIFQNHLVQKLDNKDRGIKPKTSEDRGGHLLKNTVAPAIICEPFFIDNDEDYLRASECFHDGDLTRWFCESIDMSLKYLKGV